MKLISSTFLATSGLGPFPVELWYWILGYLSQADAFRVAQLSRRCFKVAAPHIWRDVPNALYLFGLLPGILFERSNDHETTIVR